MSQEVSIPSIWISRRFTGNVNPSLEKAFFLSTPRPCHLQVMKYKNPIFHRSTSWNKDLVFGSVTRSFSDNMLHPLYLCAYISEDLLNQRKKRYLLRLTRWLERSSRNSRTRERGVGWISPMLPSGTWFIHACSLSLTLNTFVIMKIRDGRYSREEGSTSEEGNVKICEKRGSANHFLQKSFPSSFLFLFYTAFIHK